jgi:hypothetical protein
MAGREVVTSFARHDVSTSRQRHTAAASPVAAGFDFSPGWNVDASNPVGEV